MCDTGKGNFTLRYAYVCQAGPHHGIPNIVFRPALTGCRVLPRAAFDTDAEASLGAACRGATIPRLPTKRTKTALWS